MLKSSSSFTSTPNASLLVTIPPSTPFSSMAVSASSPLIINEMNKLRHQIFALPIYHPPGVRPSSANYDDTNINSINNQSFSAPSVDLQPRIFFQRDTLSTMKNYNQNKLIMDKSKSNKY